MENLKQFLSTRCISSSAAIQEIGVSRNLFYSDKIYSHPALEKFIEAHNLDWEFSSDKLKEAILQSKRNQFCIAKKLNIHFVTFNIYLKGKRRPTRETDDYFKIKNFCEFHCIF